MNRKPSIFLYGPSGIGKTTIATRISKNYGLPFVSCSFLSKNPDYSNQLDTLNSGNDDKMLKELTFVRDRFKTFMDQLSKSGQLISDRSLFDNLAFFIFKTSQYQKDCDVENFIYLLAKMTAEMSQITLPAIIYMPYEVEQMKNGWVFEDNKKRITNKYFQMTISALMGRILDICGYKEDTLSSLLFGVEIYTIDFKKIPRFMLGPLHPVRIPVLKLDVSCRDDKAVNKIIKRFMRYLKWRSLFF